MAKQFYEYALNNEPSYTKAHFAIAKILFKQQDYKNAKSELDKILNNDVTYIKAYELLVNVYLELNNLSLAREYCNKGILIDSKSSDLYTKLAFIDLEEKLYEQAIVHANESLSLKKKNNVYALEALAKANVYLCNKVASEDAISYIKKYNRRKFRELDDWSKDHYRKRCKN